jgi:signal transduction histidine kinase
MARPALRIRQKIALPFSALFLLAIGTAALVSIALVSRLLEERARGQIDHVSEMISRTDFALNPAILEKLGLVIDAEIATIARDGSLIASTLEASADASQEALLRELLGQGDATGEILEGRSELVVRDVTVEGEPYKVAFRALRGGRDAVLAIATPTSDVARAKRAIARSIAAIAALIVVLMAALSHFVAETITSPIRRLLVATRRLAAGELGAPIASASRDEVGSLVEAFNEMLERLRASEEELLRSEKLALAGQLAARVAHDVRNPLSSIKMRAQILRDGLESGDPRREALDGIVRESDRVEWVVQGLLDLARPGELVLEEADASELVQEALRSTQARLRHLKVVVVPELEAGLPRVRVDARQLVGALLNLIQNAAEAMPRGGRLFAVTRGAAHGQTVEIEIRDEGEGISPEDLPRAFDPFFTTKRDGVGLGLLNSKAIVERHGGSLTLLPAQPSGTRAVIALPASKRAESD